MKTLSAPSIELAGLKLQSIAVTPSHVKLLIDNEVVYENNSCDEDEWESIEINGKQYDLHIFFAEDINEFETNEEWLATCSIEISGLNLNDDGTMETDYTNSLVAPMSFAFDVETFRTQCCTECGESFPIAELMASNDDTDILMCEECYEEQDS
jgi:hypothetical protein